VPVLPGIDVLLGDRPGLIADRRVGLISNASGVTHDLTSNVDALRRAPDVQLTALFAPEHGFYTLVANGAAVESSVDPTIDLLIGTNKVRRALENGVSVIDLVASWADGLDQFVRASRPYFLYR